MFKEAIRQPLGLPWKRIYTTNYDNVIEVASQKQGLSRETITITNTRYVAARNLEQAIIHINGYIKRISNKTFYDEFKITDDDYNKDGLLQSPWKMIDDYGYYMPFLKELGKDFPENLKIVMACRSVININLYYDLTSKYGCQVEDISVRDLDDLSNDEVSELITVLNENHLWGEFDRLNPAQKKKKIIKDYGKSLSKVFYLLLDSKAIDKQINIVIETLNEKNSLKP